MEGIKPARSFALPHRRVVVLLAVIVLITGCVLPKRTARNWVNVNPNIEQTREEVQIGLVRISSGVNDAPYAGIRAQTKNGSVLLLVDTGTSVTLLRESLRGDLKLSKLTRATLDWEDAGATRQLYSTSSLRIGPLEFSNETVAFMPDDRMNALLQNSREKVDGILGATLFKRGEIEFRGPDAELIIRPFEKSKIRADSRSIPLIYIPDSNTYAVPLETEVGLGARFLLDTGTNVEMVLDEHRPLARRIMESPQAGTWNYDSIHGSHEVRVYSLPFSISESGVAFPQGRKVFVDSRRKGPLDGVIGIPVFWRTPRILLNSEAELAAFLGAGS